MKERKRTTTHFEVKLRQGWVRVAKAVRTGHRDELHYELPDGTAGLTFDWKAVHTTRQVTENRSGR